MQKAHFAAPAFTAPLLTESLEHIQRASAEIITAIAVPE
jgi:hypothetical protein